MENASTPRSTAEKDPMFHVEQPEMEALEKCPICGSEDRQVMLRPKDHTVSKKQFTLSDCFACGFRYTDPRPSAESIGNYYESTEYISHTNSKETLQDRLYQMARNWALKNKFALVRRYQPTGKVLDLGCGTGEFLAYLMSRGYSVQGIEPSAKAREHAIEKHSIPVASSIEKIPAQEQFQVVTMWHVLEHLHDLRGTFKRLFALLSDNGLLLIAVPDRDSWDAQHFGEHWAAWDAPRHLSHFRRNDVHTLLREHGFQLVATRRMLLDAPYIAMLSSRYKGSGTFGALVKGILLGAVSNLMSFLSDRPTSSTLYIARKSEV